MKHIAGFFVLTLIWGCDTSELCEGPPQILPHLSPVRLCDLPVGEEKTRNLILINDGCEDVKIESVELQGDTHCSFSGIELETGGDVIPPKGRVFVRFTYAPSNPDEDQVALIVKSNASNYPELIVPLCGQGYDPNAEATACTSDDECPEGYGCSYVASGGGESPCDDQRPADTTCSCVPTCPTCQFVAESAVVESCGDDS